jgi:hypothetical protein
VNNGEPTEEQWRVLAEQACKEKDSEKLVDLVEQIVKKYDESIKRKSPTPVKE